MITTNFTEASRKRQRRARKQLCMLLVAIVSVTVALLLFAPISLMRCPATGYIICLAGCIAIWSAGYLAAKATI